MTNFDAQLSQMIQEALRPKLPKWLKRGERKPRSDLMPMRALRVVLVAVIVGFWVWAVATRGSTMQALETQVHRYDEITKQVRNAEQDLSMAKDNLQVELDSGQGGGPSGTGDDLVALRRAVDQAKTDVGQLSEVEAKEFDKVERLTGLAQRWWWKASLVTIACVTYIAVLPAVFRYKNAEAEAKQVAETTIAATLEPTLESIWIETRERLRQYHEQALTQSTRAFNAAMVAMIVGGAVLAVALIYLLLFPSNHDWSTTVPAVAITAMASAYATAIARTFFSAMSRTSDQLSNFFTQPTDESRAIVIEGLSRGEEPETRRELKLEFVKSLVRSSDPKSGEPS